jgi:predicted RNA-binding protein with PUA-like domain
MAYFLAKTDPDTYSIDDLIKEKETIWDGVHNFQAINVIKKMRPGDLVYIYHSQTEKAIVGLMEIIGEPYENKDDARKSWAVKVRFVKKYSTTVSLSQFKAEPSFKDFLLIRNGRLSTMEVPENIQEWIESKVK